MPRRRKESVRQVKARIFVFCEGEKTEPNYIRTYIQAFHPTCARLRAIEKPITIKDTRKNTPKQLVEEASKFAKTLDFKTDKVWVIYDRESTAKYSDADHSIAWQQAQKNQVRVALSNVCFEYWILLHFTATSQPSSSCDDLIGSKFFKTFITQLGFSSYEKGQVEMTKQLMKTEYLERARENAMKINEQTKSASSEEDIGLPYRLKPYTNVYELLDDIDRVARI